MKNKIIIPIIIALLVTVGLYIASINGLTVPPKEQPATEKGPMNTKSDFDIDEYITKIKKKLSPGENKKLDVLEAAIINETATAQKEEATIALAKYWVEKKNVMLAAYYYSLAGNLVNTKKNLNFATHLFEDALHHEEDANLKQWMAEYSKSNLEKLLKSNPEDKDSEIALASLYVEHLGQPMTGVKKLMDIVAKDSNNLSANLLLGKMAIQSNQLEKAVKRGNLILKYHPKSWEARIFMAEAYHRMKDKATALKLLKEAKKINTSSDFIKDVDKYINIVEQS